MESVTAKGSSGVAEVMNIAIRFTVKPELTHGLLVLAFSLRY
jgi:hypothetical protein